MQTAKWNYPIGPGIQPEPKPPAAAKPSGAPTQSGASSSKLRLEAASAGRRRFLGKAEVPFGPESEIFNATGTFPGDHITLFRRLQSKWNCYDAYARVALSIGANQAMQSLMFYTVSFALVDNDSPTLAYSLVMIFQVAAASILLVDISGFKKVTVFGVSMMNCVPALGACILTQFASRQDGQDLDPDNTFSGASLVFLLYIAWLEILLFLARPLAGRTDSNREGKTPGRFRTVFYLDVFGEAEDPSEAFHAELHDARSESNKHARVLKQIRVARDVLNRAEQALDLFRLQPQQPQKALSPEQCEQLGESREYVSTWHKQLQSQLFWCESNGLLAKEECHLGLQQEEAAEPRAFQHCFVGPMERLRGEGGRVCFLDVDTGQYTSADPEERQVISLTDVRALASQVEDSVRALHAMINATGVHAPKLPRRALRSNAELPWLCVLGITRAIQSAVLLIFFMQILRELDILRVDYRFEKLDVTKPRRRLFTDKLRFEEVHARWPQHGYFRPAAVSCISGSADGLIIGSALRRYWLNSSGASDTVFNELATSNVPTHSSTICRTASHAVVGVPDCFSISLVERGLAFWPFGDSQADASVTVLQIRGEAWHMATGALLSCNETHAAGVTSPTETADSRSCLLLAGWDGKRVLVAAVRVTGSIPELLRGSGSIEPRFDVPLWLRDSEEMEDASAQTMRLAAFHMAAGSGRLWVMLEGGELRAWDVLRAASLGHWTPVWPFSLEEFEAVAICEDSAQRLVAVGTRSDVGASLLQAQLPFNNEIQDGLGMRRSFLPKAC